MQARSVADNEPLPSGFSSNTRKGAKRFLVFSFFSEEVVGEVLQLFAA
jgi:hypothetical protein